MGDRTAFESNKRAGKAQNNTPLKFLLIPTTNVL